MLLFGLQKDLLWLRGVCHATHCLWFMSMHAVRIVCWWAWLQRSSFSPGLSCLLKTERGELGTSCNLLFWEWWFCGRHLWRAMATNLVIALTGCGLLATSWNYDGAAKQLKERALSWPWNISLICKSSTVVLNFKLVFAIRGIMTSGPSISTYTASSQVWDEEDPLGLPAGIHIIYKPGSRSC